MNSAMLSVYLVPQQTRLCMSNLVSNLVQATGDIPKSPSFGWKRGQVLSNAQQEPLADINAQVTGRSSGNKIGPPACQMDCFAAHGDQAHSSHDVATRGRPLHL